MMNDTKEKRATFTPGPWVVKYDKQGLPFIGVASDPWTYPGTVATVDTGAGDARLIAAAPELHAQAVSEAWKDGAEIVCPASARLIAAAPELYEQCKLFEECLTYLINSGDSGADLERDNLRAILDKVDGGEK